MGGPTLPPEATSRTRAHVRVHEPPQDGDLVQQRRRRGVARPRAPLAGGLRVPQLDGHGSAPLPPRGLEHLAARARTQALIGLAPNQIELEVGRERRREVEGEGASGQVFKATWRQGRTAVAVKLWNTEALGEGAGDTPPASLLHEIAILRRLMHPNMCAGHACGWGFIG